MKLLIGSAGDKQLPAAVPAAAADVAAVAAVAAAAAAVPAPAEPAVPAAGVCAAAGVAAAVEIADAAAAASTARHGDLVLEFAALLHVVVGAFVLVGKPAAADGWWQWQRQHHCTGQTCLPC